MAEGEVPPLEDVKDVLKRLENKWQKKDHKNASLEAARKKDAKPTQKSSTGFGGMKKGFLFGGSSNSDKKKVVKSSATKASNAEPKEPVDDIPLIKANPAKSSLVLSDVQEALKETREAEEFREKITNRIEGNSKVANALADPAWIPILCEFQQDPEGAMRKYKDDEEIRNTMLELCNVLGYSFLHMKPTNTSEEEKLAEKLMEDPKVKEALTDPCIMEIMLHMRIGANDKVQSCLQRATPEQKMRIQTLIDFGLISFAM